MTYYEIETFQWLLILACYILVRNWQRVFPRRRLESPGRKIKSPASLTSFQRLLILSVNTTRTPGGSYWGKVFWDT